jgi:hypothetical protein
MELDQRLNTISKNEYFCATGKEGTVYLFYPFLIHEAQNNFGATPKYMEQSALLIKK